MCNKTKKNKKTPCYKLISEKQVLNKTYSTYNSRQKGCKDRTNECNKRKLESNHR